MAWIVIVEENRVLEGTLQQVSSAGREFAVCRKDGEVHVLDNACPHVGGPLGRGNLDGYEVVCPWHAWPFDCRTGQIPGSPGMAVKKYAVRVENGLILIEV